MRLFLAISTLILFTACGSVKQTGGALTGKQKRLFNYYYYEGAKQKILGDNEQALENFEDALKAYPSSHATMYQIAGLQYELGNVPEAIYYARKAVEGNPNYNHWYYGQLAQFYNRNRQFAESAKVFEKMIDHEPDRITNYFEAMNQYLNLQDGKGAIRMLDKLDDHFGITEESALRRREIQFALGNIDAAIEAVRNLSDAHPQILLYKGMLAETQLKAEKTDEAIKTYEEILKIDPDNGYAHFGLAEIYQSKEDSDKAFKHLKVAFADPKIPITQKLNVLASYFLVIRRDQEMLDQALQLGTILTEVHPQDAMAYTALSDINNVTDNYRDARKYLLKALEYETSDFRVWQKLLSADEQLNNFDYMIEDSRKAIEYFPNQPVLYIYNSYANLLQKNLDDAIATANAGLEIALSPKDQVDLLTTLADAYHQKGENDLSDQAFDELLEIAPDNALALNNYAYYLALRNTDLNKALDMIEKVMLIDPNNPSYLDTHGWVLYQLGRYEEAEIQLKQALDLTNDSAEVMKHYGETLIKLGRMEEGQKYLDKATEIEKKDMLN